MHSTSSMKAKRPPLLRENVRLARFLFEGKLSRIQSRSLTALTRSYRLSLAMGDMLYLDGKWYITASGLLRIATRGRCQGIRTSLQQAQSDPAANRWVFRATVYKSGGSRGFVGYGDADPSNVSPLMHGAEMRIAETRAVNRALRKAYGIGLCSVEELGWPPRPKDTALPGRVQPLGTHGNDHNNGQSRLRDQLCLLIRQYNLDPNLVKAYAAHFCGTETLKEASRNLVASFVSHLAASAKEDLDGLVCKLNSFAPVVEVHS